MKPSMTKLSPRGQVVIPEEIRTRLGLQPGDEFVVVGESNVIVLKTVEPARPDEIQALLDNAEAGATAAGLTPEDVERVIREVRAEK